MQGDGKYQIIWKLVEQVGGTPSQGDSLRDLLAKYLTAISGTPVQGDTFYNLLVKVVDIKGGAPSPGDKEWDLLVKWLQAEGECRKCGDSVHDLWKKILALGEAEPEPTAPEVRVQQGATGITDGQIGAIDFGVVCQSDSPSIKIFTVFNDGTAALTTSGLSVPAGYTILNGLAGSIAPGGNDTFTVQLDNNNVVGTYSGNISFNNNDASENPFNFPITGQVFSPLGIDTAFADSESPWNGNLTWFWPGGEGGCTTADPTWFGIELDQDGAGFGNVQFEIGSARAHLRASDSNPHSWTFRIAAFDEDFNRVTEWAVSDPFSGG